MSMKLTPIAQKLKEYRENNPAYKNNDEPIPEECQELATCMGSEHFSYALYEGGYLKPEEWVEGVDLNRLQNAIALVGEFKEIVEMLHEEF